MERLERIELSFQPWQGRRLPLHQSRKDRKHKYNNLKIKKTGGFGAGRENRTLVISLEN